MPLRVVSCCTYLTGTDGIIWRPRDYDAHDFVMAVKGRSIDGFAQIPCRGQVHRIDDQSQDRALQLFGQMIADLTPSEDGLTPPLVLIPVPNSRCDLRSSHPPRTRAQAEALAGELGAGVVVWDGLRWCAPLRTARSGRGTRDPQALFDRLTAVMAAPRHDSRVVFVDDVLATGGHLQACAAILKHHGSDACLAVVAGRSDWERPQDPFATRIELLADFAPRERHQAASGSGTAH